MTHCAIASVDSVDVQTTLIRTANGRMPYFPALDGVRAYCVLLVMFDHLKSNGHTLRWLDGHLGVDLFFILSGFLITTILRREQSFRGRIDFPAFYWRRFFRIVPVYAVVLALYLVICQRHSQAERWVQLKGGLPYFLTLMNEFAREPHKGTVFLHTWSLGVEEKFYLLWPILFFVRGRTVLARWLIVSGLFVVVAVAPLMGHGVLARAYFGLLMGCVMGIVLSAPYAVWVFRWLRRLPPMWALLIFGCGFWAEHLNKWLLPVFSSAAVLFVSSLLARESWLTRLHACAPLVWIGKRSYSMYLVHVLCLNALETHVRIDAGWKAAAVLLAAFCLTAALAELLYWTVETPVRQFGRRYLARRREIAAAL